MSTAAAAPAPGTTPHPYLGLRSREPIRAELFGPESLEAYALRLAAESSVTAAGRPGPLLRRFADNGRVLARAHRRIVAASRRREPLTPDAEWLLDNFYIIEEVLREVRHDLPRGYYRELPRLERGPLVGYPRVYALALAVVAHTDSGLDEDHLTRFVHAYQTVAPLTIGELWAVPTMLRLALLENLRRLAEQMLDAWDERARAEGWAARHLGEAESPPDPAPPLPPLPDGGDPFVVRLMQLLRDRGLADGVERLRQAVARKGTTVDEVLRRETQRQAVNQVSVGNCVTSLRLLAALDWNDFFERASLVEALLRQDPGGVYPRQDFRTRDRYRRELERLARRSGKDERAVARALLDSAGAHPGRPPLDHVGHYLVGAGRDEFRAGLGYRPSPRERLTDWMLRRPRTAYFGLIGLLLALSYALLGLLAAKAPGPPWAWALLALSALVPLSELAVNLANQLVTLLVPPRLLPRLEFRDGVPPECATFVVVPCMLLRPQSAATMLERLEIHYLANPDPRLSFALLTDFADSPTEHRPEDEEYLGAALEGVKALNERYAAGGPPRFFVFHRARKWNPSQGCWMGWERKRGKLGEFNRLLRGARDTGYTTLSADPDSLPRVAFVLTLDADTRIPHEAARRLIGTLAHPLNRPRFDPARRRVVEGYGVLQPRVSFLLDGRRSLFGSVWAASAGVDPYSTAVSDVYMDLFGLGSFTGKGIYDVDAFEAATGRTFPDNHILSHDLIEGNFARCGLVTDIELFDEFPQRYHTYARREHRWVRGDWQLLPWLGRSVPVPDEPPASTQPASRRVYPGGEDGGGKPRRSPARVPNPLPLLERWKVFDNLRRSLVAPALVLMLALGWTLLPGSPWLWSALALLVLALPLLLQAVVTAVYALRGWTLAGVREFRAMLPANVGQVLLAGTFLADQARTALDAILRTLVRLALTRRRLLEWETAASTERRLGTGAAHFLVSMWPAPVLAAALAVLLLDLRPGATWPALPFLLAWFVSPLVAFLVSRDRRPAEAPLDAAQRRDVRRMARRTWGFFERFVGEEDHWLPPDNFQEEPEGRVAHRTSPTNQGLLLLSTLAAHDLGYLSLPALLDRLGRTLDTLGRLERYRGHFLNWYDTLTLAPLQPAYISTVDSGNLLGCLVTLRHGLADKLVEPPFGPSLAAGLEDALGVVDHALNEATAVPPALADDLRALRELAGRPPHDLAGCRRWLDALAEHARRLAEPPPGLDPPGGRDGGPRFWVARLAAQVLDRHDELTRLAPWAALLAEAEHRREALEALAGAPECWQALYDRLNAMPGVADFLARRDDLLAELDSLAAQAQARPAGADLAGWLARLAGALRASAAGEMAERAGRLATQSQRLAQSMDFRFLYRADRNLFAIGYSLAQGRLDVASYDLLASEARIASFLAVARGDAPRRHWFQLGRPVTRVDGRLCLVSWGGTMFEYLMPELVLPCYPGTLLYSSRKAAVQRQREYARHARVPWGISESAFSSQYTSLDYQYQSFGVPGLGLKRALEEDLVIAPYATALALTVEPRAALENLHRLAAEGVAGGFGFYESVDYTPNRLPQGRRSLVVRCFMAHHQGMSLVAMANCLLGDVMPKRFRAEPMVRSADLLLQERVPYGAESLRPHEGEGVARPAAEAGAESVARRLTTPDTPGPRTHLLSNGRYTAMLTNAGGGYSRCDGLDVTRWREDFTRDAWGQFCYVRELRSGRVWSAPHQPVCRRADDYEVLFAPDKADFRRLDGDVQTHLEVTVSPENRAEVRRLTLTNLGTQHLELELTSYLEPVLAHHPADLAHPAFGKLFLETEWVPTHEALLCRRRPRAADQKPVWAVHVVATEGEAIGPIEFETDRARFLGRGRTPADPAALDEGALLSGTTGPVLDPVLSLRRRVRLAPGASATVTFSTALAESRDEALALVDHHRDPQALARTFELAWALSQIELRHLQLTSAEAHLFQRLAAPLLIAGPALRAHPAVLSANSQGQPALWRHGISGDRPIALARVGSEEHVGLARQMLAAHAFWRRKGLEVDLVLLNEQPESYLDEVQHALLHLVRVSENHGLLDKPGGIFVRKAAHLSPEDRTLLHACARLVVAGDRGSLSAQVERAEPRYPPPAEFRASARRRTPVARPAPLPEARLLLVTARPPRGDAPAPPWVGGFTPDAREYHLRLSGRGALPPAPWVNVVANPNFGFLVSESGSGFTWWRNSQANRLTPWSNDAVADPAGEAVYLRDEDTGAFWSPTPRPCGAGPVLVRHGQGYTTFESRTNGLSQSLRLFVPPDALVKVLALRVRNEGERARRLSAWFFAEWVLGTVRDQSAANVITSVDPDSGALLARNPFNADFAPQVGFADVGLRPRTLTGDRTEFLGRNGSVEAPAALRRVELSGRVGPALDPCAGLQAKFELGPGREAEVVFLLGAAGTVEEARRHLASFRDPARVEETFKAARALWDRVLGAVEVQTPDPALDVLLNRWLPYQVLSCRMWGRTAFYQSSGAFGFRDQLQDSMAMVYGAPQEARAQIVRAAGRQFAEGDVQHWWHPPHGRGVRTRCSDDYLWLPFVVCHYVATTGDESVLDERVPFLHAPALRPEEEESYGLPDLADGDGTVYEHCGRALKHGLRFGAHGLPLMGTGDWNDGMNKVGAGGKGESVWVGWFLLACLKRFAPLAERRGDSAWAKACRDEAERLRADIESHAWDGGWYLRAWFDDGTPLGSWRNAECQIDSISQSWAVLSGGADPERAARAVAAVEERLVRDDERLVLLFTPPFDRSRLQPGYVKGYVPGIRENGGQYTHAATWVVEALAELGRGTRAGEVLGLLNPVRHAGDPEGVARYKVEPYVVAGDVYGQPPHVGRGGWTWYTGSAAWLFRVALEGVLGLRLRGDRLALEPCLPAGWPGYTLTFRRGATTYRIEVQKPAGVERGVSKLTVDGVEQPGNEFALASDGGTHVVRVWVGE
jgi:cyclic beta-1,2-glucan synthetase